MLTEKPSAGLQNGTLAGSDRTFDRVLVISSAVATPVQQLLHKGSVLVNAGFSELTAELLARVKPDCILAPLVGIECDVVEVASRLNRLGYHGLLLAVTGPLPNPTVIRAEVRAANPNLTFDLIENPPAHRQP